MNDMRRTLGKNGGLESTARKARHKADIVARFEGKSLRALGHL
jgi:hypothetical protein